VVQQRRLAGAEKAGEDGDGLNTACFTLELTVLRIECVP
jgi:hypothetical protein